MKFPKQSFLNEMLAFAERDEAWVSPEKVQVSARLVDFIGQAGGFDEPEFLVSAGVVAEKVAGGRA